MIKTIYSLEPIEYTVDRDCGVCAVTLMFNGKKYRGVAELSPQDEDFFSEKVGLNIALSRARIKILTRMVDEAKHIATIKYQMYREAGEYGKLAGIEIDPTGNFWAKVMKAHRNYKKLMKALKAERVYLNSYLTNQNKMVKVVKLNRARAKSDN